MKFMTGNNLFILLIRLWRHLNKPRQSQFILLIFLMFLSAFAEVISLGAVLPFIGALIAPDTLLNYPLGISFMRLLGATSADQLALPLTIIFSIAALVAGSLRILLLWLNTHLACSCGADLGSDAYRRTLYQPYRTHIDRASSEVISGITNKIDNVVFLVMLPLLVLISSTLVLMAIMAVLIMLDPISAAFLSISLGFFYSFISGISRRKLLRNSDITSKEQTRVIKTLQEGLGSIRYILLDRLQSTYLDIYRKADNALRTAQSNNIFLGQSPRYIIESIGMVFLAIFAYLLSEQVGGIAGSLPVLCALALGAQRLLPALQQAYNAWANITGNRASLVDILSMLDQPLSKDLLQLNATKLVFQKSIEFRSVCFRYSHNSPWVLDRLNLYISKGSRIGIVGSSGSGKSTAIDLLMGLLTPELGEILVDGELIRGDRLQAWQKNIAHVPQSICLSDATFAENIAFGLPPDTIDLERVRQAASNAQIADFIESYPEGYQAYIGERGIRLSGGQRQRIAIARALYKEASVLVLDEATSALDSPTEQVLIDTIEGLNRDLTVFIVAHRLTTVRCCDNIFELKKGNIMTEVSYADLAAKAAGHGLSR
jgi:ABC-type multidrug transport system fused ATPase/permease subunit